MGIYPQQDTDTGSEAASEQASGSVSASDHSYNLTWTADREEFIGRNGSMEYPAAMGRVGLSCRTGTHYESCGAVQTKLTPTAR
ncbi:hypothetical protein GCM10020331_102440 [Ectobacillus funiculus]